MQLTDNFQFRIRIAQIELKKIGINNEFGIQNPLCNILPMGPPIGFLSHSIMETNLVNK